MKQALDIQSIISQQENILAVCNDRIEHLTHPEVYGCCLSRCNSIVINKERMMTVTTDETRHTTYEFAPLYPTYFSPKVAADIMKNDVYMDIHGNRIKMEVVGELEYYKMLKEKSEKTIELWKSIA